MFILVIVFYVFECLHLFCYSALVALCSRLDGVLFGGAELALTPCLTPRPVGDKVVLGCVLGISLRFLLSMFNEL